MAARALGLHCEFGHGAPEGSSARTWNFGRLDLLDAELAHQSFAPIADDGGEHYLFLKLIKRGEMVLEQGGQVRRFQPGEIVLVDPIKPYRQSFTAPTQLVALRIPKQSLKERGFRHHLRSMVVPDMAAADVRAIGDLVLCFAGQSGATSLAMRRRQGAQLLDVIDLVIDDPSVLTRARSGDATLFRAKRFIAENLRNVDLTATLIASEVGASEAHLNRLFKTDGYSLMRYVWYCRLELAADLLKRKGKSQVQIQEIAFRCGFSTPAHFSRSFKERYGVAPREAIAAVALQHPDGDVESTPAELL
jgi:AraC-like DNA-binding protein